MGEIEYPKNIYVYLNNLSKRLRLEDAEHLKIIKSFHEDYKTALIARCYFD